jgi:hypothetical protein
MKTPLQGNLKQINFIFLALEDNMNLRGVSASYLSSPLR